MNICVCSNYDTMSKKAAHLVTEALNRNPESLISFPGGDTPVGMFKEFVAAVEENRADISRAKYVSLDEWVGLSQNDEGSCGYFNREHLFKPLKNAEKAFAQVHLINGASENMEAERQKLDDFIDTYGPLSVSVLGIGLNGHLGFNEEFCSFESKAHITELSQTTKQVMSKYFGTRFSPEYGITQGIGQIMEADLVILMANGEHKADILYRSLKGPVQEQIPASVLQKHPNCYVVTDSAAGERL